MGTLFLVSALLWCFLAWRSQSLTLSSKLIHRFSEEAREIRVSKGFSGGLWPTRGSMDYYSSLVLSDIKRQKRKLGTRYKMVFPSEGSETMSLGNDFGWLHYTWVDIGTPNISFLVALDAGSDLFWVPCDCIQCASLSGRDNSLDKDLSMYRPAESSTSKHLSCSHELCALGTSCKNPKEHCPYLINYSSENTTSSGLLVEDTLYLSSDDHTLIQAPVVIGCGRRQSGGYLDGIAPDGLLGLGLGDLSVPTFLAKEGLVRNSFSMCFEEDDSGRIFFGDQGISTQQSTPFVTLEGKYLTYIVGVEGMCIGSKCPRQTNILALVDSGSSFTFLPDDTYRKITGEFDRQMNRSRFTYEGAPWEYCYRASSLEMAKIPKVYFKFAVNKRFDVKTPIFPYYVKEGELDGFCLALQSSTDTLGIIGQNMMMGYRMVFDKENLKLGWSDSNCHYLDESKRVPLTPSPRNRPENPLPTAEQQGSPNGRALSPAVAERAPTNTSVGHSHLVFRYGFSKLLLLLAFSVIFAG